MTGNVKAARNALLNASRHNNAAEELYTYSDLIVDYLAQVGVEYVFGIQGGAIEPFYNAIARRRRKGGMLDTSVGDRAQSRKRDTLLYGPQAVFARHETGAAFMAEGYYRESGKMGVCCATTGPGTTNLITGVASAYAEFTPMLVITPQSALPSFGRSAFQESTPDAVNVVGMFDHCTRYNSMVTHPDQLEGKLITAIAKAFQHPRGPVHLSIPTDILKTSLAFEPIFMNIATQLREPWTVDSQALSQFKTDVLASVSRHEKLVLMLGHACGDAIVEIERFAELCDADIISTPGGTRWINAHNKRYKGVFGFSGHPSSRKALEDPQVGKIIAVGTGLGETSTAGWDRALLNNKLIHVESCADNFVQSPMARLHVFGNKRAIFKEVVAALEQFQATNAPLADQSRLPASADNEDDIDPKKLPEQLEYLNGRAAFDDSTPIKPQRLMHFLSSHLPSHTRYFLDTGNSWAWGLHYLHLRLPGNLRIAMNFGSMGWAIGAAVGSALACNEPTVCITGDGSVLMSGQEITVALERKLPLIFLVLNDSAYGMIKHGQRLGTAERVGWQLPVTDFAGMAKAMGANGIVINSSADLQAIDFEAVFESNKPTLLDVRIDPNEIPPMGERVKILQEM